MYLPGYTQIERKIINNSDINVLVMEANELGIEDVQKILKRYKLEYNLPQNSLHIVANKYNWRSISIEILKNIFGRNIKFYKMKFNKKLKEKNSYKNKYVIKI